MKNDSAKRKDEELQPLVNKNQQQKNDVEAQEKEETIEKNNKTLVVAFCLMLIFQLGNRIFGKLETVRLSSNTYNSLYICS